eukprot:TRINITY_DN8599_c0_g1_i1.p1 TRINITY_DN8599_c0_g1~~TRINITY_DN8599_c0_g1_i1.p1  ORF type:complete len:222 (-),score=81.58 TRINITY_DN8599_c0_g1_i1:7-672(-)
MSIILKPSIKHSASIIFLHGLGDTAHGWSDVCERFNRKLPYIKFILPTAPIKPVTINGGFRMTSWYDIVGLSSRDSENCEGIEDSRNIVMQLVAKENEIGIPPNRIMICGFSQGAALSLFTVLQSSLKFAGCVALSGYTAKPSAIRANFATINRDTPILMCHGRLDNVVRYNDAVLSSELLKSLDLTNFKFESYDFLQHSACEEEIDLVEEFIEKNLPLNP